MSLLQRWPFCWWVACVIDHDSRRVVGFCVFDNQPTSVEMLRRGAVPFRRDELRMLLRSYICWYHEHRPHQGLGGRTPNEVYVGQWPANERARIEPRAKWPWGSPCSLPAVAAHGRPGRVVELVVQHLDDDARLPIVELKSVA
jgi:hypothetical protein